MQRRLRDRSAPPGLLRRASPLSVWAQLGLRILVLLALLAVIIGVHWLERDQFKDNLDGHMNFADVIYFTMISATTTGYGDIVPVTDQARLFDALIVTPVRIFFLLILSGTAYTFVIKRTWDKWLMQRIQMNLQNHVVVAGFGVSGSESVAELIERGIEPKRILVVDPREEAINQAEAMGCIVIQADATRDATLEAIRIAHAAHVIVSAGRDDTSILITLTVRHLAPNVPISVVVRAGDNELPARAAGATTVINPVSFAGLLLAGSAEGAGIADYITDLASAGGRVRLHERVIEPFEVGKSLKEAAVGMGLRILRGNDVIGFWEVEASRLEPGDKIIEIIPAHAFPKVPAF
jgi:voltage-gated potassium channel